MSLSGLLQRILDWLHAGYPQGVPAKEYYPLLAFLARSLKPEEVSEVVTALQVDHEADHLTTTADVRAAIEAVTKSPALRDDVKHVEAHLRGLGWDLDPVGDH